MIRWKGDRVYSENENVEDDKDDEEGDHLGIFETNGLVEHRRQHRRSCKEVFVKKRQINILFLGQDDLESLEVDMHRLVLWNVIMAQLGNCLQ